MGPACFAYEWYYRSILATTVLIRLQVNNTRWYRHAITIYSVIVQGTLISVLKDQGLNAFGYIAYFVGDCINQMILTHDSGQE